MTDSLGKRCILRNVTAPEIKAFREAECYAILLWAARVGDPRQSWAQTEVRRWTEVRCWTGVK
jgi:hypothetical protein